ncbi:hypothetical protein D9M72_646950 [compost metagenome]
MGQDLGQDWNVLRYGGIGLVPEVGHHGTDAQDPSRQTDLEQLADMSQIHEATGVDQPECQERQQTLATGDDAGIRIIRQHLDNLLQRGWSAVRKGREFHAFTYFKRKTSRAWGGKLG